MPWFRVDDNLAFHHKVVAAGNAAIGLWVRAGALCASQLTDGFVPDHMIAALGGSKQHAARLVAVGLWDTADGGYRFHEWLERQPSKEHVEAEREAARQRMATRRRKRGQFAGSAPEVRANTERSSEDVRPPLPDPTLPVLPTEVLPADRFPDFWAVYPRRVDRGHAVKAFASVVKGGADPQMLIDAARLFAEKVNGSDPKFVAHASTWLRGERWTDEDAGPVADNGWHQPWTPPAAPPEIADDPELYAAWLAEQRKADGR